jgi:protein-tyrosine phosphatase
VTDQFQILVVCLGNVCRSPLAERLLRARLDGHLPGREAGVSVASAGARALVGAAMDQQAAAELRRLGGDPDGAVSRQLEPRMVEDADLVLTATRHLRSRVLEEAPRALKRTFTITEFAALVTSEELTGSRVTSAADLVARAGSWRGSVQPDSYDVPDPIGQSEQVHREVADLLDRDCSAIARAVVGAVLSDVGAG